MPSNLEMRIVQLEILLQAQAIQIRTLQIQATANAAGINQAQGIQFNWQPGGDGGGLPFFCICPSGSFPGTAPPGGAPGLFPAAIYQVTSGGAGYTLVSASADVFNAYPSSPVAGRVTGLLANGDGTYTALSQSCT